MSEPGRGISRTIEFHRKNWANPRYPYLIATTRTDDPEAPVELVRPYSDGSGNEVLVSLTTDEWDQLIAFVQEVQGERSSVNPPHGPKPSMPHPMEADA